MPGKHDAWARPEADGEEGDDVPARPAAAGSASFTGDEEARIRRIVRSEVTRGWEAVGVDFSSLSGRQEAWRLLEWCRERKRMREAGTSKIWTTAIGAVVSALIAAAAALFSGKHV